jgi:hypothetical protein
MFIDEEELQPKYEGKNWYYQQILKLKIANFIKTKYYLILDIDMYLIKPLCFDDMFYENKIIYTHEKFPHNNPPGYTNTSWWENSAKLLNYNVEKLFDRNDLMGVTPQLLLTCVVKDILLLMESKYGVNWEITLIDKSFTEFTLYWIFLIQNNMEQYYTTNGFPLLDVDEEHTVLHPNSNETIIRVTNQALSSRKYHFFLVQNWLKIDLSVYWHLLPLDSF